MPAEEYVYNEVDKLAKLIEAGLTSGLADVAEADPFTAALAGKEGSGHRGFSTFWDARERVGSDDFEAVAECLGITRRLAERVWRRYREEKIAAPAMAAILRREGYQFTLGTAVKG